MKKKHFTLIKRLSIIVFAVLLAGGVNSCTKTYDIRLNTLEKSLNNLEQNYKDYSPEKLKREMQKCENQFEKFDQDKDKLTMNQRQQLSKLDRKFNKILIKIGWNLIKNELSDKYREVLEYIKDLLKERWDFTDDLFSLATPC